MGKEERIQRILGEENEEDEDEKRNEEGDYESLDPENKEPLPELYWGKRPSMLDEREEEVRRRVVDITGHVLNKDMW